MDRDGFRFPAARNAGWHSHRGGRLVSVCAFQGLDGHLRLERASSRTHRYCGVTPVLERPSPGMVRRHGFSERASKILTLERP